MVITAQQQRHLRWACQQANLGHGSFPAVGFVCVVSLLTPVFHAGPSAPCTIFSRRWTSVYMQHCLIEWQAICLSYKCIAAVGRSPFDALHICRKFKPIHSLYGLVLAFCGAFNMLTACCAAWTETDAGDLTELLIMTVPLVIKDGDWPVVAFLLHLLCAIHRVSDEVVIWQQCKGRHLYQLCTTWWIDGSDPKFDWRFGCAASYWRYLVMQQLVGGVINALPMAVSFEKSAAGICSTLPLMGLA